jgi:hypothetical protein
VRACACVCVRESAGGALTRLGGRVTSGLLGASAMNDPIHAHRPRNPKRSKQFFARATWIFNFVAHEHLELDCLWPSVPPINET